MAKSSEGGSGKFIRMCATKEEIKASFPTGPERSAALVTDLCHAALQGRTPLRGADSGSLDIKDCLQGLVDNNNHVLPL